MASEVTGWGEFAKFVTNHILGNEYGYERLAIVYGNSLPNHIRNNHRSTRPGFNDRFTIGLLRLLHLFHQLMEDVGSFFDRSCHLSFYFRPPGSLPGLRELMFGRFPFRNNQLGGSFLRVPGLLALRHNTCTRSWMAT